MFDAPKINKTRFPDLGFVKHSWGWRIVDLSEGRMMTEIGPLYHSKAELLADLTRYATQYYAGSLPT